MNDRHERMSHPSIALRATVKFWPCLLLALVLSATGCARKIEGAITDQDGHPVDKAYVSLLKTEGKLVYGVGPYSITDQNGHYSLRGGKGEDSISVMATGFQTISRKLEPGARNPVNLTLYGHRFKVGDHVRVLYPGWCTGTVTAVGDPRLEGMYNIKLDDQSHGIKGTMSVWQNVAPIGDPPANPEPCSLYRDPPKR
jgi:carboxypeptidase family protein